MSLYGALAESERTGKEVVAATGTFASNGELEVTTPFAEIDGVGYCLQGDSAPTTSTVTYSVDGNVVTFHAWEATASGDTALTSSDAEATVAYVIIGRRWKGA